MSASKVVLILGAGPRIGASVAASFSNTNHLVALASRKGTNSKTPEGHLSLSADLSKPETIPSLFTKVKSELGAAPTVVIYNAAALTPPTDKESSLSIPSESLAADLNVNTVSPYAAAQQAVAGWETLGEGTKGTFIYTGNILNTTVMPVPIFQNLGVGKAASAHWIGLADLTHAAKGYRFFYADERHADGKTKGLEVDGPAHAEFFAQLAAGEGTVPWHATFVKGKGYVKFD